MKLLKYIVKPMKYIIFICAVFATLYFRSIIFHDNVNHYINSADTYLETKFEIDIPEYIAEKKAVVTSNAIVDSISGGQVSAETNSAVVSNMDAKSVENCDVTNQDKINQTHEVVVEVEDSLPVIEEVIENEKIASVDLIKYEESLSLIKQLHAKIDSLIDKANSIEAASISNNIVGSSEKNKSYDVVSNAGQQKDKASPSVDESTDKSIVAVSNDASKVLIQARQMFWNGNLNDSEKYYLDLMTIKADDPDVYGELGNVYYAQGKWSQAGKSYYEAAIRLLDLNKNDQVSYLLRVIQGLDSESAEKLRSRLIDKST